ncbi:hypothetical protein MettiDRAFT_2263 [Methanolobus tindarius DSM 2278]|jgi:hypothetical protein|uniref:Uncharacterized protein n=1 Tax=Methanolobus tindarius DSM 2278 TaxID=1090322 RepID=W9DT28_METTI|nr:hypothetical protein [Methanolobus tindarius]ETA68780.1 hypothetical protein MettiDRAFT_2263 [Methanolobus tindarius DSM 2278]
MNWKRALLVILGIILTIHGLNEPMNLIFPMWIFTYLFKDNLINVLEKLPLHTSFIGAGVLFGLLTEVFAIVENLPKPAGERILLSQNPVNDVVFGFVYYLFIISAWYLLLRKIKYTGRDVFLITGIYGIFVEETGQVFLRMFTVPVFGLLYVIIIMFVYGIFPMLTHMLNEKRFSGVSTNAVKRYSIAFVALFIQYAIYGLFVLPALKSILS